MTVKTVAGLGKECGERVKTSIRLESDVDTTFSGLVNAAGSVNKSRLASKMAMRGSRSEKSGQGPQTRVPLCAS